MTDLGHSGVRMSAVSATDLKQRGVAALEPVVAETGSALITVRGRARYVVMTIEEYRDLRATKLEQAIREIRADQRAGRIVDRTIDGHLRRLDDEV